MKTRYQLIELDDHRLGLRLKGHLDMMVFSPLDEHDMKIVATMFKFLCDAREKLDKLFKTSKRSP